MIYEYRKYVAAPGKMGEVNQIFEKPILTLFDRHGMDVVGFWTSAVGGCLLSELHYILRWTDTASMQKSWARFQSDPEWIEASKESARGGATVAVAENQLWTLTPYSPIP